jgi:membrane protease YdiL (CAAX protease family)
LNNKAYSATTIVVPAYIIAIAVAEILGPLVGVVYSAVSHAFLILILLGHYGLAGKSSYRRIFPVLALAPLMRILSLTLPVKEVPQIYWYALIGLPLLAGIGLTARLLDLSKARLGMRIWSWPPQVLIALSGLPLSIIGFWMLQPPPLITKPDWQNIIIDSVILMIFSGFTEEILFRGLLLRVANEMFGYAGSIFYSSALFAIMYIGSQSFGYMVFIALVGLFFSWCVHRTGSIWGVVLAHGLMNIGMALVWPFAGIWINEMRLLANPAITMVLWLLVTIAAGFGALMLLKQIMRAMRAMFLVNR